MQPTSRLDVPAGWLVRASLGDAIAITLTGPARAWSERAAGSGQTVVHLDQRAPAGVARRRRRPPAADRVAGRGHRRRRNALLRRGGRRRESRGGRARTRAGERRPGLVGRAAARASRDRGRPELADDAAGAGRDRARAGRGAGGPRADTAAARGHGPPVRHRGAGRGRRLGREAANRVRAGVDARRVARGRPAVGAGTGCGVAGGSVPAPGDGAGDGAVAKPSRPVSEPPARATNAGRSPLAAHTTRRRADRALAAELPRSPRPRR